VIDLVSITCNIDTRQVGVDTEVINLPVQPKMDLGSGKIEPRAGMMKIRDRCDVYSRSIWSRFGIEPSLTLDRLECDHVPFWNRSMLSSELMLDGRRVGVASTRCSVMDLIRCRVGSVPRSTLGRSWVGSALVLYRRSAQAWIGLVINSSTWVG
jgi:hypothetical protein